MRTYKIDLDLPPRTRWSAAAADHAGALGRLQVEIHAAAGRELGWLRPLARLMPVPAELVDEMLGVCDGAAGAGVALAYDALLQFNCGHELVARCTSALVRLPLPVPVPGTDGSGSSGSGSVAHVRCMDWDMPLLRELTVRAEFWRGGAPLFTAVTWVGMVGVLTGMAADVSVSLNFRKPRDAWSGGGLAALVQGLALRRQAAGFFLRRLLQDHGHSFDTCLRAAVAVQLLAPAYLVMAGGPGAGAGAVVVKGAAAPGPQVLGPAGGPPLVQTNHDAEWEAWDAGAWSRWAGADPLLQDSAERRRAGLAALATAADVEGAMAALRRDPLTNLHTVYRAVMVPGTGRFECEVAS